LTPNTLLDFPWVLVFRPHHPLPSIVDHHLQMPQAVLDVTGIDVTVALAKVAATIITIITHIATALRIGITTGKTSSCHVTHRSILKILPAEKCLERDRLLRAGSKSADASH